MAPVRRVGTRRSRLCCKQRKGKLGETHRRGGEQLRRAVRKLGETQNISNKHSCNHMDQDTSLIQGKSGDLDEERLADILAWVQARRCPEFHSGFCDGESCGLPYSPSAVASRCCQLEYI